MLNSRRRGRLNKEWVPEMLRISAESFGSRAIAEDAATRKKQWNYELRRRLCWLAPVGLQEA